MTINYFCALYVILFTIIIYYLCCSASINKLNVNVFKNICFIAYPICTLLHLICTNELPLINCRRSTVFIVNISHNLIRPYKLSKAPTNMSHAHFFKLWIHFYFCYKVCLFSVISPKKLLVLAISYFKFH